MGLNMAEQATLSIGALAQATSVPVNTLRTWERRHGFPRSVRLPSGHRRFYSDQIVLVRWIIRALEAGYRPSALEDLEVEAIRAMVTATKPHQVQRSPGEEVCLDRWFEQVSNLDTAGLKASMTQVWSRVGAIAFLSTYVSSFLDQVGQGWADGRFSIAQEHAASAALSDFLAARWRELLEGATGPSVVLGTLPGELHSLGLQQAAVVVAMRGVRVHFVGANTPVEELAGAAKALDAHGVIVSVSVAASPGRTRTLLDELRGLLPDRVELLVGGRGAPDDIDGHMSSLASLDVWAASQEVRPDSSH